MFGKTMGNNGQVASRQLPWLPKRVEDPPLLRNAGLDFVTWRRPATDALPFQDRRRGRGLDLVK